MRVFATADLHGNLPEVPGCDLLLIGGDVCPVTDHDLTYQFQWLDTHFRDWLQDVPAKTIIGIAGNHDFAFEHRQHIDPMRLPWTYLCDEATMWNGLKIYGLPWVPNLPKWAFHLDKEKLAEKYDAIPASTDIVLSHGPPYGYGDALLLRHWKASEGYAAHYGAKSATNMLHRVKPQVFICGHIHEAFGWYPFIGRDFHADIYNVSFVDADYKPRRQGLIEIGSLNGQIVSDGPEESPNAECEVRSEDPDTRSSPEPVA